MLSIILLILMPLQAFGGYDSSQASDTISRTLGFWGGKCQTKCEENRPTTQCEGCDSSQWRDGMFNCYDFHAANWGVCTCRKCQRHECSIDETGYEVSACDIDTIQDRTQDLKTELFDLTYNHVSNSLGVIPKFGPLVTAGMTTVKGAYGIYKNDKHEVLNGVIADIKRQADQLKDCMDEKIDDLRAEVNLNEMQDAWLLFDIAAGYDGDDLDDLMSEIKDAWTTHLLVANSEFDDIHGKSATYFKKLLLPLQAFVQTFAQVSADYLRNLYLIEPVLYPDAYFRTIEGFESLKTWATAALDTISKDMDTKSHQIACEDGRGLLAGLVEWKIDFTIANIDPIESYILMIESMNELFELETLEEVRCPGGTVQIGRVNADIGGCGLEGCVASHQSPYSNIEACRWGCLQNAECKSFLWAPEGGGWMYASTCELHSTIEQTGTFGRHRILCREDDLDCPAGTMQIGEINADIGGCGLESCDAVRKHNYANIDECKDSCLSNAKCKSFLWAPVGGAGNTNNKDITICELHRTAEPTGTYGNYRILCKV